MHAKQRINTSLIYRAIYNTRAWRKLRLRKLAANPLCERCASYGKICSAEVVHHKREISRGADLAEMKAIAFDFNNLQSLCKPCHDVVHERIINLYMD